MHSSKSPNLSMFFSRALTEKGTDFLSLYFEQQHWGQLFELVEAYGSFQLLKQNADEFILSIGKYEFKVVRDFHRCIITIGQISSLSKGAAELLAKIADLMFYDRKHRFMINTNSPQFEEILWNICFELKIPIKPADKAQAERFAAWATKKGIAYNTTQGFSQAITSIGGDKENPENPSKPSA